MSPRGNGQEPDLQLIGALNPVEACSLIQMKWPRITRQQALEEARKLLVHTYKFKAAGKKSYDDLAEWINRSYLLRDKDFITGKELSDIHLIPQNIDEAAEIAGHRLKSKGGTKSTVICEMWDPETGVWYFGRSKHGQALDKLPKAIRDGIPKVDQEDLKDWCFGKNCAEVECIIKAYASGKKKQTLEGCYFIAYHQVQKKKVGPCHTCKQWIAAFGGVAYKP
ncbi:MAG TPA: hypothetical protein VH877_13480 [Polyangia bacterium]|jgi:hypothetical protein|nr:hypothetical protein [Polyangia bacterium]